MKPPHQPPHRNGIYPEHTPESLLPLLNEVDKLHERFIRYKRCVPEHSDLWRVTREKLCALWTYHSNAIEGSTLTLGDTIFFLQEGLTVQGKPLQDFLAAQNHAQTIDYLFETVSTHSTITEGLMQHINAMLLYGVCPAPMFVLTNQACEQPECLTVQMRELTDYIAHGSVHPVLLAAVVHGNIFRIQSFGKDKGRSARVLMNMVLMQKGYLPAIIRQENRRLYQQYLNHAAIRLLLGSITNSMPIVKYYLIG